MSTLPIETLESNESLPLKAEALLARRAQQRPGVTALADPPNLPALDLGEPRSFTYHEADVAVDALASFFVELGLKPGDTIAAQLPNVAVAPLTLLAAWRAGLTVAMPPMLWRAHEIARVCEEIAPKALIGVSHFAGENYADRLCGIAAEQLSVRFVLGYGPELPDGVASLDVVLAVGKGGATPLRRADAGAAPALITFTARAGVSLLPVIHSEAELLAQGAMTVLVLALDRKDVILNAYPLTGPAGLTLGLMPWLISGSTLVQHHPFDYAAFVEQLLASGATVTALPAPVLAELAKDDVLRMPACRLRRLGSVWPSPDIAAAPPPIDSAAPLLFDVYPLGDLTGIVLRREARNRPQPVPLGPIRIDEDGDDAVFVETKLAAPIDAQGFGELLVRGPVVPQNPAGPLAPDVDGFVGTGVRAAPGLEGGDLTFKRDPELLRHGGMAVATSEFDALYRLYPGFLDAACFVLPDPIVGDRIFAAVAPRPGEPVSLEALKDFLAELGVAPYKFPDRLLVVKQIPRDLEGRVLRDEILRQV
jgi:non-ribosomal peptide synthetase component E (peptide arylation enzyme)